MKYINITKLLKSHTRDGDGDGDGAVYKDLREQHTWLMYVELMIEVYYIRCCSAQWRHLGNVNNITSHKRADTKYQPCNLYWARAPACVYCSGGGGVGMCVRACVRAFVRACARACVCVCGRACVRACVRTYVLTCVYSQPNMVGMRK